jgi:hypothetical protein
MVCANTAEDFLTSWYLDISILIFVVIVIIIIIIIIIIVVIVTCMGWLLTGFGLDIGFTDHLYIPLGTKLYESMSHTDQCFQSITVSTCRLLATNFNTEIIPVSL